ncbi:phosphocarrier protein HPr [Halobacillus massiliensis]|uniref:phosphocarrier protein HPr n=1 Tax=Halobacillus massiliensis TaxID=1926286 RepID=UPI0009E1EFBE|nr:phosphocarrier protein HPr [Halobacillus massiliensis]
MSEKIYTIKSQVGIHARPATQLVESVSGFTSEVVLVYEDKQVNLKSIMGIMSLGIPHGAKVKVIAKGSDELQVLESIDRIMDKEELGV